MTENRSFIRSSDTCAICGADDVPGCGVFSTVTLMAGYGSAAHDGKSATIHVCGDCLDWLWTVLRHEQWN